MDNFFPDENYKIPTTSNYMKFSAPGDYTFRVLTSAVIGYEYFNRDNKPQRSRNPIDDMPDDIKVDKDGNWKVSHFWAFAVWNYEAKKIQILELTQKTIMGPMHALIKNPKWGNPKGYDITVTRKGTGLNDTEYAVVPNPHTELDPEVLDRMEALDINLDALFTGGDPLSKRDPNGTHEEVHPVAGKMTVPNGQPKF